MGPNFTLRLMRILRHSSESLAQSSQSILSNVLGEQDFITLVLEIKAPLSFVPINWSNMPPSNGRSRTFLHQPASTRGRHGQTHYNSTSLRCNPSFHGLQTRCHSPEIEYHDTQPTLSIFFLCEATTTSRNHVASASHNKQTTFPIFFLCIVTSTAEIIPPPLPQHLPTSLLTESPMHPPLTPAGPPFIGSARICLSTK